MGTLDRRAQERDFRDRGPPFERDMRPFDRPPFDRERPEARPMDRDMRGDRGPESRWVLMMVVARVSWQFHQSCLTFKSWLHCSLLDIVPK